MSLDDLDAHRLLPQLCQQLLHIRGAAASILPAIEAESAQCCVTSPPYWGLRDYDHPSQPRERTPGRTASAWIDLEVA
jgi:hypothetical protein